MKRRPSNPGISDPGDRYDLVITNPPNGQEESCPIFNGTDTFGRETISYTRQDFRATTSNKQLNFLQHVKTLVKINGRAAIVVPDSGSSLRAVPARR